MTSCVARPQLRPGVLDFRRACEDGTGVAGDGDRADGKVDGADEWTCGSGGVELGVQDGQERIEEVTRVGKSI